MKSNWCIAMLTAAMALSAQTSEAAEPPVFYVAPGTSPADIGVGDYITKWLMPVVDIEERDRYRAANQAVGPASAALPRVIFLGDSITELWKGLEGTSLTVLPHRVLNRGIAGQLSTHMLLRLQADVLGLEPRVLVLLVGTNDIRVGGNWMSHPTDRQLQRFRDNLTTIVDATVARGVRVILCTLPPVHDYTFDPKEFPVRSTVVRQPAVILEVNAWIADLARLRGLPLADYHAALVDDRGFMRREYSNDGLHPNEAGYRAMLAVISPLVHRALAPPTS